MTRRSIRTLRALAAAGLAITLIPSAAQAHLVTTGLGPIYDGIMHLALSPDDLVPVVALGLFAGLRGAAHGRVALFVLPLAWLLGGVSGLAWPLGLSMGWTTASFLMLGGLVATDLRLSRPVMIALSSLVGLMHGHLNGEAMAGNDSGASALFGVAAALFVVTALSSALVVSLQKPWTRIAVRVAGSWITAIGLLMLGWSLRSAP